MAAFFSAGASLTPSPVMATHLAAPLQRRDDAQLVGRRDTVRRPRCPRPGPPGPRRSSPPARARSRPARPRQPELARDRRGGERVIAGDHDRRGCRPARRCGSAAVASGRGGSVMSDEAEERHAPIGAVQWRAVPARDRQHAQPVPAMRAPARIGNRAPSSIGSGPASEARCEQAARMTSGAPFDARDDGRPSSVQRRHPLASPR